MVRFKLRVALQGDEAVEEFQSHNGSIQTADADMTANGHVAFQSHNGSIQTRPRLSEPPIVSRFNPTMVRFKHCLSRYSARNLKVSIPQWFDSNCSARRYRSRLMRVSIPQWFDSNLATANNLIHKLFVSIPQWFDSNLRRRCGEVGERSFQSHNGSIQTRSTQKDGESC